MMEMSNVEEPTTSNIVVAKMDDEYDDDEPNGDDKKSSKSDDSKNTNKNKKKSQQQPKQASVISTLQFVFDCGIQTIIIFCIGIVAGIGNGGVYPALAYLFSNSFSDISNANTNGLEPIKEMAFKFLYVGVYALAMATIQTVCFEIVAYRSSQHLRLTWFRSLLRQDPAFFDVYDIGGIANNVGPQSNAYRRGVGRKFGEGIQFMTIGMGGLAYALYASWRVALVVFAVTPLLAISAMAVVNLNQTKSSRAAKAYSEAGSVAYSTISSFRTVLSLNATEKMILKYKAATQEAFKNATAVLLKQGFANGSMLGSFICCYVLLTLYGTSLLYKDIEETGCDPSGGVEDNETCESSGPDVFGAMLGVAFAAQGMSQVGSFLETFSNARTAAHTALQAINRKPGAESETIYYTPEEDNNNNNEDDLTASSRLSITGRSLTDAGDIETPEGRIKAILPEYRIDSSSTTGSKPEDVSGRLTFDSVSFAYPTRPGNQILTDFSIDVEAGKTIAFVGPSGGGKSTVVKMLERFYDPVSGSVKLDGVDIKDINLKHFRSLIGYVGQEPTLFATSIAKNIKYGNPSATQEQIEEAARLANAHDFISSFPDKYDTNVGDKGTQLSGGQKQRIAIARVLVANPKILLLDEATSALDSESELVVQEALDNILTKQKRTTVIIAHRLSTIRNADVIAVVMGGTIVEKGSHEELMVAPTGYYRNLVDKADKLGRSSSSLPSSRENSETDLEELERRESMKETSKGGKTLLEFKDISFSYPTRPDKMILDGFNLKIKQGETVALVGPSGGGKSTTVALIERFYDPNKGSILYSGTDLKTLNVRWYRDQIGYVGQEPTLFNDTIANNIAYGAPSATRQEIEEAARQANAYDFISNFPEGFDTPVGERGGQLSGGQKQRIAIARALVKKPEILVLDEATSALDNESEAIVQEALDRLTASTDHTCVVIAHRLTTIMGADRIAFIADGKVKEIGSHEKLVKKKNGRYKRLVEAQKRDSTMASVGLGKKDKKKKKKKKKGDDKDDEEEQQEWEKAIVESEEKAFNLERARKLAGPDALYLLVGSLGAIMAGSVFPLWGLFFAETIELLFIPVYCDETVVDNDCPEYWDKTAEAMRERSFEVAALWTIAVAAALFGNTLAIWGFGTASERLSKRVRDSAFTSLVRQEVSYFDMKSVGVITSQLADDAAMIHTFTGEPIRSLLIAMASVLTGLVLSFSFMWPFALLAVFCVPLMGFATSLEMSRFLGTDIGTDGEDENSPGGIVVETLLNIGTVNALTMEDERFKNYEEALLKSEPNYARDALSQGFLAGLSMFIQQWINGLQLWWGGYILTNFTSFDFTFNDFLISNFALLFSLFGLGAAFQDISDRKEAEKSAGRIFYLLDRQSAIDPMGDGGLKIDRTQLQRMGSSKKKLKKKGASTKDVTKKKKKAGSSNDLTIEKGASSKKLTKETTGSSKQLTKEKKGSSKQLTKEKKEGSSKQLTKEKKEGSSKQLTKEKKEGSSKQLTKKKKEGGSSKQLTKKKTKEGGSSKQLLVDGGGSTKQLSKKDITVEEIP